ncbi:creatine kinase/arginine kinase [Desulfocicer vacuolatum DSM 3385]|uniref:Creatine kinase/arginine kinase n=1 Tax=Desulfocicer vacuolatum DSM 3385 TaxID=1121400 RepID=A0A1W1ZHX9_9BACT|nr:phosphagen kinase [Desulfocicer vacuolatum]SMC47802.1 creatine kinase/arginine kinase [Desulfocicer vacuolatum DSM 3385]
MNFPVFSKKSTALAGKHLTESVFSTLKEKKTPNGFSLPMALASGIKNHDSGIGIYAGDAESYAVFSAVFSPLIEEYHGIPPGTPHGTDRSVVDLPNPDPRGQYILSTRIRVARNLAGYAFTPFIQRQQRREVTRKIMSALASLPDSLAGIYLSMEQDPLSPVTMPPNAQFIPKKQLQPMDLHSFIFKKGDRFQEAAGINRDWPDARGCFISQDTRFRVWINEEDHLRIISMDGHGDMSSTFNRLAIALENLESTLKFAWNDTLGYLAACPSNIGTGMRAGVHICLPRLFHQQDLLHKEVRQLNLQVRGTQGEKTRVEKAVFDISNERRLGITERKCLVTLHRGISRLIELEQTLERKK